MKTVNEEYFQENSNKHREAYKSSNAKVSIRKIEPKDLVDGEFTQQTIEGDYKLRKEQYIENGTKMYVATNLEEKDGQLVPRQQKQNTTGELIDDSWIIEEGAKNKYQMKEDGNFVKKPDATVTVFQADEPLQVNVSWSDDPLQGKTGDYVAKYGEGDFNIIDKKAFEKTYEMVPTIEEKLEMIKQTKNVTEKNKSVDKGLGK